MAIRGSLQKDNNIYYRERSFTAKEFSDLLNTYLDHTALAESIKNFENFLEDKTMQDLGFKQIQEFQKILQ